ncbi:hypothetical protein G7054_g963 [Neopestalotiopsis clavispora]|nr:hypothetical protein G7054_g963 [Neopestalotiopsis clavispora]
MAGLSSIGPWSFNPIVTSFPPTLLPNIAYWNVTNGTYTYQVQLSWPLNWTSTEADSTVDTLFVLDGNALAQTATEAFRKRRPVEFAQPDTIVVSIGYPDLIPDSPYSNGRYYDYQMPVCATCEPTIEPVGVPSGADAFITFLDTVLRPWVRSYFPRTTFNRDGLYGHSFGGLFAIYALMMRPDLFDVFLSASPYLIWNNEYIFDHLGPLTNGSLPANATKPALQLAYGSLEEYPRRRRTETDEAWEERKTLLSSLKTNELVERFYSEVKNSSVLRDVDLLVYPNSYHAAVGSAALCDGIDYFLDW